MSGNSTGSGAAIVQQTADNALDQEWQLVPVGDGDYKVVNRTSHLQLPLPSTTQGTQLIQMADDKAKDSQWRFTPTGSGSYTLAVGLGRHARGRLRRLHGGRRAGHPVAGEQRRRTSTGRWCRCPTRTRRTASRTGRPAGGWT